MLHDHQSSRCIIQGLWYEWCTWTEVSKTSDHWMWYKDCYRFGDAPAAACTQGLLQMECGTLQVSMQKLVDKLVQHAERFVSIQGGLPWMAEFPTQKNWTTSASCCAINLLTLAFFTSGYTEGWFNPGVVLVAVLGTVHALFPCLCTATLVNNRADGVLIANPPSRSSFNAWGRCSHDTAWLSMHCLTWFFVVQAVRHPELVPAQWKTLVLSGSSIQ